MTEAERHLADEAFRFGNFRAAVAKAFVTPMIESHRQARPKHFARNKQEAI